MKHTDIIRKLNLEQKCALLSGETVFTTRALPGKGIPSITLSDGPNGVRKQAGAADHLGLNPSVPATCFPTSSATACSWDEALGEAVGEAMGEEAAAQEVAVLLGPGLNIQRSPLCGRDFEYFSEDPILAGKMAAAYVRGIQKNGISACPKHFAVNSQELRRMASDSVLDERTLRELYLTGFEIVVKEAKPKTIMTSYNLINGTYANEKAHLLQDILRKDWRFDGAVVTDWGGSNDHALGVKNGSTLEMPCPGGDSIRELMKAVKDGKVTEADLDARLDELLELVLSTHAVFDDLVVAGPPNHTLLDASIPPHEDKGSIITVLATDIPLSERQLRRLCHRALVGLSRTGSFCGNGSGEIVIAFTTANRVPHYSEKAILPMGMLHDDAINPLFRAVAECVEESVLSSLLHAETVTGYHGRTVRCLSDLLDEK